MYTWLQTQCHSESLEMILIMTKELHSVFSIKGLSLSSLRSMKRLRTRTRWKCVIVLCAVQVAIVFNASCVLLMRLKCDDEKVYIII